MKWNRINIKNLKQKKKKYDKLSVISPLGVT